MPTKHYSLDMGARGRGNHLTLQEARELVARYCPAGLCEVLGDDGVLYYFTAEDGPDCEDAGRSVASIAPQD